MGYKRCCAEKNETQSVKVSQRGGGGDTLLTDSPLFCYFRPQLAAVGHSHRKNPTHRRNLEDQRSLCMHAHVQSRHTRSRMPWVGVSSPLSISLTLSSLCFENTNTNPQYSPAWLPFFFSEDQVNKARRRCLATRGSDTCRVWNAWTTMRVKGGATPQVGGCGGVILDRL